jgi:hypothetical protein
VTPKGALEVLVARVAIMQSHPEDQRFYRHLYEGLFPAFTGEVIAWEAGQRFPSPVGS